MNDVKGKNMARALIYYLMIMWVGLIAWITSHHSSYIHDVHEKCTITYSKNESVGNSAGYSINIYSANGASIGTCVLQSDNPTSCFIKP